MKPTNNLIRILALAVCLVPGFSSIAGHLIVAPSVMWIDGSVSPYNSIHAGDTLLFQAGNKTYLGIKNFTGSATSPIVMINTGGAVTIGKTWYYGIKLNNCKYVKLTGTGTSGVFYGFQVLKTSGDGLSEENLSTNIEVDHISLDSCALRGIVAKTDEDCGGYATRNNFTQYNTYIHDCYIAHTGDEGMYIGSSFYAGKVHTCSGVDSTLYPSLLNGVKIYNNIVKYTGWDGIQVGSATTDCQIHNNLVMYDSQSGTYAQMSGIIINEGSRCDTYNNYIYKGKGDGIESLGLGDYKIFNNVVYGAGTGYTGGPKYGIYCNDNSAVPGSTFSILFNNIINPITKGIKFASTVTSNNLIASNAIINPGTSGGYIEVASSNNVTTPNNYTSMNISAAGFADTTYHLNSTSPLINSGYTDNRGITSDYWSLGRPVQTTFDIGICEYQSGGSGSPPTVTTAAITNITQTTATGGGNVTADGGATVTERGVCWGTTANPTTANSKTTDGTGTGTFTSSLTGLTTNTLYYVRAYATNCNGTSYGTQVTFTTVAGVSLPTVTTTAVTNITTTTATSGGNVTADGGATVTARGVCWSTSANPTTANNKTTDGTGTGTFTSSLTGLTANTLYYVRAYATNSAGTAYGAQVTFTTVAGGTLATVTTTAVTNITTTTATSGGNVTADGGTTVTARGVCWSTSANPTTANSKTTDGTGTGTFTSSLTGLTANTLYYVRAYATNSAGTAYGAQVTFTTLNYSLPTVTTTAVTNITTTTATSGGNVTSDGGATVTARGVCWSTSANPTTANNKTSNGTGTGSFTSSLTGLTANTLYYVRAYATNSTGTAYGNQVTFTTLANSLPTVTTAAVSNITATTAKSGGNVTAAGGSNVTARGVCWRTSPNPTTSNSHTHNGTGTGSFTSNLTGLSPNTLYYVRAYATNSSGTSYGNQVTFTTLSSLPTVTTTAITNITQTTAKSGGNVTYGGGSTVTSRGVCWKTSPNPTKSNSHTNNGSGTGSFTSNITGLTPNTLYYVRAYATNSYGTTYGNQLTFTTLPNSKIDTLPPGGSITSGTIRLYPNPVNTTLNINYVLDEASDVDISIFDARGIKFYDLHKQLDAGSQTISIDVSDLPVGLYLYISRSDNNVYFTRKFIRVK
jgi:hypothetical protein